jgi:hypothetical protein
MLSRPFLLLSNRWVWRSPRHAARKLLSFAATEQGSCLTLLLAAAQTTSLSRQALYLKHAQDEARHATMFWRRGNDLMQLGGGAASPLNADAEDLFQTLGEERFLAFVHHAECRGRRQFEVYKSWFARRGDSKTENMIAAIVRDEQRHEAYSLQLLQELCGSRAAADWALFRARSWELFRAWRRLGRDLAHVLYVSVLLLLSPLLWPYAVLTRQLRPAKRGWHTPAEH